MHFVSEEKCVLIEKEMVVSIVCKNKYLMRMNQDKLEAIKCSNNGG